MSTPAAIGRGARSLGTTVLLGVVMRPLSRTAMCWGAWSTARPIVSLCRVTMTDPHSHDLDGDTDVALADRSPFAGVIRFYELAKRAEWQTRDLPWGELPPVPEYSGSPQKLARRQDLWRSVITQQLQADELAVEMATQLFAIAPDPEAKLYYTTMVQDESRHTEGWLQLVAQAGGMGERDPYLDQLAHMTLEADTLEEKVFLMQVFYERLIIPRFRLIARSSRGTVLEDLCNRLAIDDGIHHGAGMAYERVLLATAGDKTKNLLVEAANRMLPLFVQHALWRPKAREFVGQLMHDTDVRRLHEDVENGVRLARSLGLDVSDIQLPVLDTFRRPCASTRTRARRSPPSRGAAVSHDDLVLTRGRRQPSSPRSSRHPKSRRRPAS